jgi:translation initiation factor IF-3
MEAPSIAKELRINERILAPRVRLIRDDEQLGIVRTDDALRMAEEAGLDLVEVAPTADPPVCRIMDYGKFKYEQSKREKESRKGSKHSELREVRMRVKIDEHDIDFKARTARKLLAEGDKVKVSVMFRAREITHPEIGRELLDRFYEKIRDVSTLERNPAMEGRMMSIIVTPGVKRERQPAATSRGRSDGQSAEPAPSEAGAAAVGSS